METAQFDGFSKVVAMGTTRRQALVGLGALALGSTGFLRLREQAAADTRQRCHQRCRQRNDAKHGKRKRGNNANQRHDRCHRKCESRS